MGESLIKHLTETEPQCRKPQNSRFKMPRIEDNSKYISTHRGRDENSTGEDSVGFSVSENVNMKDNERQWIEFILKSISETL